MTDDKYTDIYNKVKDAFEKERLFLRPDLSLVLLSRIVGTNTVYLSKAINRGFGCSFHTLVNRMRIQYLVRESQKRNISIETIANECAFWSRSTFYDAFRQYTGMTPRKYMERPQYKIEDES